MMEVEVPARESRWDIIVDFRIVGLTEDPQVVTDALAIQPTRTWLAGDLVTPPATARRKESNGWVLESGCSREAGLAEHFESLVTKLKPASGRPIPLSQNAERQIRCGITDYVGQVPLIIPIEVVDMASKLGANIYLSYYDLSRAEETHQTRQAI